MNFIAHVERLVQCQGDGETVEFTRLYLITAESSEIAKAKLYQYLLANFDFFCNEEISTFLQMDLVKAIQTDELYESFDEFNEDLKNYDEDEDEDKDKGEKPLLKNYISESILNEKNIDIFKKFKEQLSQDDIPFSIDNDDIVIEYNPFSSASVSLIQEIDSKYYNFMLLNNIANEI
jgi:hypothetical protein